MFTSGIIRGSNGILDEAEGQNASMQQNLGAAPARGCDGLLLRLHCLRGLAMDFLVSGFGRVTSLGFRVSGFGFRVSGFEFRVSDFGFRVSGFGLRVAGSGFRISNFGFRA